MAHLQWVFPIKMVMFHRFCMFTRGKRFDTFVLWNCRNCRTAQPEPMHLQQQSARWCMAWCISWKTNLIGGTTNSCYFSIFLGEKSSQLTTHISQRGRLKPPSSTVSGCFDSGYTDCFWGLAAQEAVKDALLWLCFRGRRLGADVATSSHMAMDQYL